jgi:hypothetical protein
VAYEVDVATVRAEIDGLPRAALVALAEALSLLELDPWAGAPLVDANPGGAVRTMAFGPAGLLTYVVVEQFGRVDLLQLHWVGA